MAMLEEKVKEEVKSVFKDLKDPVRLIIFTQDDPECKTCNDNQAFMEEVASLSDKINLEVNDFMKNKDKVEQYNIDKIPATVVQSEKDYGIRFYGVPSGYEFSTLLNAIKLVSSTNSELSDETKERLKTLSKPVHIQVFVTLA